MSRWLFWRKILAWILTVVTLLFSWQLTAVYLRLWFPLRWWSIAFGLFCIHLILAVALLEGLSILPWPSKVRYRLAFVFSFGVGIIFWFSHPFFLQTILGIFLGVFTGCLMGTSIRIGLWEDNFPPPAAINREVLRKHQEVIGISHPVPILKRGFDIGLSFLGLLISSPLWVLSLFAVWFEDPGPLLFVKNSVGKGGHNFHQFKIRTMVRDAEVKTGPILAAEDDTRALRVGRLLRKTALDELPQLVNILRGDMSFVGPRPQRTVLVHDYLTWLPEFAERARVLPGLAGLAQVAGSYYITPRQKLRYDRIYVRHVSLGFDLKLICLAFMLVFYLRWKPGDRDRIPRAWLH